MYQTRLFWQMFWQNLLAYALASAIAGILITQVSTPEPIARDDVRGAMSGGVIALIIVSLETFAFQRGPIAQAPFLVHLTVRTLSYVAVIIAALVLTFWLLPSPHVDAALIVRSGLLPSMIVSFGFNVFAAVNRLLGPGVLLEFVAGRYHRPRREDRVLLFIDLADSTRSAAALGETAFLTFLNRFIGPVTTAIASQGGEIHKYMGDEVIASWKLGAGVKGARCIRACFDAIDRLARQGAEFERDFGRHPRFRAALHCGPVVLGELGAIKLEIALIGETMNATARIEEACRDTGHDVLASAALIDRIADWPAGISKRSLGPVMLRGRAAELELFALTREPQSPTAMRNAG
ncbi:MAG TPA: adenylate/guanylate cyclase domain-containing protein [Stellaceae bacterium]|nr:adenylate/guanylate cyclase domain-containing protein [Stellaceae bacterium]